jgi:HEAT repeat protein
MRHYLTTLATALVRASLLWLAPAPLPTPSSVVQAIATGVFVLRLEHRVPPEPWRADDPADSLYRAARSALNDGEFARAATLFRQIGQRYPKSEYAADAPYWEAFARYRMGGDANLREALASLDAQRARFPKASTRGDAQTLATRIRGELARRGDPAATATVMGEAAGDAATAGQGGHPRGAGRASDCAGGANDEGDEDSDGSDTRIAALNALMQMDSERAMPILREVLARRDACSAGLRRKALFIVAQKQTSDAADILLAAARTDPDAGVRRQAVFWMSQVGGERALAALDSILRNSTDADLREKAIFAISQQDSEGSRKLLRDFAQSPAPASLRGKAVFWLGQSDHSADNATFLHTLYGREQGEELRHQIIQAAANLGTGMDRWLFSIAEDTKQPVESRKKALFWLGQQRRTSVESLVAFYDRVKDPEMREQAIFVLSQRDEKAAVDKLIDIARHESDRRVRGKALFWLGQSHDPRVKDLLMEIINQ